MFISDNFSSPLLSWVGRCCTAARFFPQRVRAQMRVRWQSVPRVWRVGLAASGYVLLLSNMDALFGGGISLALKEDVYWSPHDQTVNDFYQAFFGMTCIAFLLWRARKNLAATMIAALQLGGYVEDRLYYVLMPLFSPIFRWRHLPGVGIDFPDEVSGWLGWCARVFWGYELALDSPQWFLLNVAALCLGMIVLLEAGKDKTLARESFWL